MTFLPTHGLWSTEGFTSVDGFTGTDLARQTVTGGFAQLVPQVDRSVSYFHPWAAISGWDINNGMPTESALRIDFSTSGGKWREADTQSGSQGIRTPGGMWEVITPPLQGTGEPFHLTGQAFEYFSLESGSPNTGFFYKLRASSNPFVIEFDVASLISVGTDKLKGILSGQLTGLPAITGVANHGVYISNGPNWDYLEARPDGLRSYNHPELAIPIDLTKATRFRIGIRDNDIFILSENGHALAGLGKFDTVSDRGDAPILAFGSPETGSFFSFNTGTANGFVGHSFWDNVKVLHGELAIDVPANLKNLYVTSTHSLYTPDFDAGVSLKRWLSARVDYLHKPGGTTVITPEYLTEFEATATTGYQEVTAAAVTLQDGSNMARLDLSLVPASVPLKQQISPMSDDNSTRVTKSVIRFRIDQHSHNGRGPAPIVDKITVQGAKDIPYLETIPDWKPVNQVADIELRIKTNKFLQNQPEPKKFSTLYFRSPLTTGVFTGDFIELSNFGRTGTVIGTGEIVPGPYDNAFQTYTFTTGAALTGTVASELFGTKSITNFIPDPGFDKPFRDVSQLITGAGSFTAATTGSLFGKVGEHVFLPTSFTGQAIIEYSQHKVHRLGKSVSDNFAQKVNVKTAPLDRESCGIEIEMPAGIGRTGTKGLFQFNLKIEHGPGVVVYATGDLQAGEVSSQAGFTPLPGSLYTGKFHRVSVPVSILGSGNGRLGIVAETGGITSFIVDDLKLAPMAEGYLKFTGVETFKTPFGTLSSIYINYHSGTGPYEALRACTILSCDLFLDIYPTGISQLIQKIDDKNGRGFSFSVNSGGFPVCVYDISHNAFYTGGYRGGGVGNGEFDYGQPTGDFFLKQRAITGLAQVPLGVWTNLGFMHQSSAHRKHGGRSVSGQLIEQSIAASNIAILTIDGLPVMTEDTNTDWLVADSLRFTGLSTPDITVASPVPTFISDNTGSVVIGSGMHCRIENVQIGRPPSADAESSLYMDAARVGVPYFVPDVMLKPGGVFQDYNVQQAISDLLITDLNSPGIYTASVWNLDNPGPITNWDHGYTHNHLLFFGDVGKDTGVSPYSGFGSTRFKTDAYAKARYSSAYERLANSTGHWDINPEFPATDGQIIAGSWVYARDTGVFFEVVLDEASLDGAALVLDIVDTTGVLLRRRKDDGTDVWNYTGYLTGGSFLEEWHHVGFTTRWLNILQHDSQGVVFSTYDLLVDGKRDGDGEVNSAFLNDAAFGYIGDDRTGLKSAFILGRGIDCSLADAFVDSSHSDTAGTGIVQWHIASSKTGNKGGCYNTVYFDSQRITGNIPVVYNTFSSAIVTLPKSILPKETMLWAGVNNYNSDEGENLEGIALYPTTSFTESEAYAFRYDDSIIKQVFGGTDSPIRIGSIVPQHAINLARIDSPSYSVPSSITTIDLSDTNPSNLSSFRGGQFTVSKDANTVVGKLVQRDSNGDFEIAGDVAFPALSIKELGSRVQGALDLYTSFWKDWIVSTPYLTGFGVVEGLKYAWSSYDIVDGAGAGPVVNLGDIGPTQSMTGGFITRPKNGIHSLGLGMITTAVATGLYAVHTNIVLTSGKDHLFRIKGRQPYYPGNINKNIAATVIGYTGKSSLAVVTDFFLDNNVVGWYDPAAKQWEGGSPAISGFPLADNFAPGDDLTEYSFPFTTTGFSGVTPDFYGIWIAFSGTGSIIPSVVHTTPETNLDFVVIDEAHIYEIITSDASGDYRGINAAAHSGQFDMIFKDQIDTSDLRVTSISVADPELDAPAEAYYAYLLGRGEWGLSIPDAFPHASGSLNTLSQSGIVDRYINNLERVKDRISVKSFDGKDIDNFQWDIVTSPFTYTGLLKAVDNNEAIAIDGIGTGTYSGSLPDGTFSVILVSPHLPSNGNTVFVHFPAYNLSDGSLDTSHREIYNPIPLMRETLGHEVPLAGQFSLVLNQDNQKFYDLTVYGLNSGFSGDF